MRFAVILTLLFVLSCSETVINEGLFNTDPVDIEGSWRIERVLQNEEDITENLDFSGFQLDLDYGGDQPTTFSVQGDGIPFVTSLTEGNWEFDNPTFPSNIHFIETDSTELSPVAEALYSSGNARLVIEFSMGCPENVYTYEMIRVE